jgi:hypothetical protein
MHLLASTMRCSVPGIAPHMHVCASSTYQLLIHPNIMWIGKRKLVSAAFSLQNVLHFEPHVRRHIRLFFAQWDWRAAKAVKGTIEGARDGWSFFNVPSRESYRLLMTKEIP